MNDRAAELVVGAVLEARTRAEGPVLAGIAGSVAVGKTTLAEQVAIALDAEGVTTAVLATDCFLLPNDDLAARGLLMQKGFPDSYDVDAIARFLDAATAGEPATVPVYSHEIYDRAPGASFTVGPAAVYVVEGVNALRPPLAPALHVAVYVDAAEADIERWYVERFLRLIELAETDEASFYRMFVPMDPDQRRQVAASTWSGINAVNLHQHIEPTRSAATLVLRKAGDHSLELQPG